VPVISTRGRLDDSAGHPAVAPLLGVTRILGVTRTVGIIMARMDLSPPGDPWGTRYEPLPSSLLGGAGTFSLGSPRPSHHMAANAPLGVALSRSPTPASGFESSALILFR
jgi:hypothetical protein